MNNVKVTDQEKFNQVLEVNTECLYISDSGVCQGDLIISTQDGHHETFGEFLATEFEKEFGFILVAE